MFLHLYDVQAFQKITFDSTGGYSEQLHVPEPCYIFLLGIGIKCRCISTKNRHSRRNAVEPRRTTFYRGGFNYIPNTFEGRTAALYGRI
jgi:hypothetical protein